MNVVFSKVKKLSITGAPALDEITVFLENFAKGQGKITIECYGKCWTSYWGSMGERTIEQFFIDSDNGYLSKNLSNIAARIRDFDQISKELGEEVEEFWLVTFQEQIEAQYGDFSELPMMPNPEYQYLNRIIDAVRDALSSYIAKGSK